MQMDPLFIKDWQKRSADSQKKYKRFLETTDVRKVMNVIENFHDEAFKNIDCLNCAACCKNYSPRFKKPDIKRIAKFLKLKEGDFIEKYLYLDEDGDYVVKTKPCAFLSNDNACSIYDVRPSDCSRFPYTNEDVFVKRKNITIKNSTFCPIAVFVLEKLVIHFPSK